MKSPVQLFIAVAILLATATVAAQVYKWVDKDGKVQYTDTPPAEGATKAEPKKLNLSTSTPTAAAGAPPKTLQDRAKDFDKRKTDAAEQAKKAEEMKKEADANAANCTAARTALRELESGRPMVRTSASGEREVVDDTARQADIEKARKSEAAFCK